MLVVVPELSVHVATGDTIMDKPNRGFSVIYAEILTDDKNLIAQLLKAKEERIVVTMRCAMLDVVGPITKAEPENNQYKIVLAVEDLNHRKPRPIEVIRR